MEIPRSFPLIDENFYVKNNITYEELMFLWRSAFITIQEGLIGVVTESLRAIALNFDGKCLKIIAIFYCNPTEDEMEDLSLIEGYVLSSHYYKSDLEILVIPDNGENLHDIVDFNLRWIFLRKGIFERNLTFDD